MLRTQPELQLKLIDFNIAHDLRETPEIKGANGRKEWSAPETRKFQLYDEKCDVWSVGCILHYLCCGKPAPTDDFNIKQLRECTARLFDFNQEHVKIKHEDITDLICSLL